MKTFSNLKEEVNEVILEKSPILSDSDDSRRFVFKMPEQEGESFTANFEDGSSPTVKASKDSAGKYCLIAKSSGRPLECWEEQPSEKEVAKRIQEVKAADS